MSGASKQAKGFIFFFISIQNVCDSSFSSVYAEKPGKFCKKAIQHTKLVNEELVKDCCTSDF